MGILPFRRRWLLASHATLGSSGLRPPAAFTAFDVTEAVAAYGWNLDKVRHLLRDISSAMSDEVEHRQGLRPAFSELMS
jgi:hypothetical protein